MIFLGGRCSKATVEIGNWMLRADMAWLSPQGAAVLVVPQGDGATSVGLRPWHTIFGTDCHISSPTLWTKFAPAPRSKRQPNAPSEVSLVKMQSRGPRRLVVWLPIATFRFSFLIQDKRVVVERGSSGPTNRFSAHADHRRRHKFLVVAAKANGIRWMATGEVSRLAKICLTGRLGARALTG